MSVTVSQAFDILSGPGAQRAWLENHKHSCGKGGRPSNSNFPPRGSWKERPTPKGCWGEFRSDGSAAGAAPYGHDDYQEDVDEIGQRGGRRESWWDASWSEFEKRLRAREEEERRREAMEAALLRGEDSLDAYMSILEAEMSGQPLPGGGSSSSAGSGGSAPEATKCTASSRGSKRPPEAPQAATSSGVGGSPWRRPRAAPVNPAASANAAAARVVAEAEAAMPRNTLVADALLSHLDSDGSEIED
eukprot:TRINITY_DN10612_c1_g1_i1.p1 TRINITY_DN10612_c1_g1~~TRINITY_DN10612_c1_g1_i1.p1  ORF type:complete len:246 (-),score=71.71 TRINITY_DN10612_c1_g1_i1:77-814(-)